MKLSWFLYFLILSFSTSSFAQELSKKDVEQVLYDSNHGNIKAQDYLGGMYYYGKGVPLDYVKAVMWWHKTAVQGSAFGQRNYGSMLAHGLGTQQDYTAAVKWFRKAAEQGDAEAQNQLAHMLYNGRGVSQNYTEATKWFQKAAEQGNANAKVWIPYSMKKQNEAETFHQYKKLAEQGDAEGQFELGNIYRFGRYGEANNGIEAIKWYNRAIEQGYIEAQVKLGEIYQYGNQGVTKNITEALKWYRKAAELENANAQYKLGSLYRYGMGVNKDLDQAKKWLNKAEEQGNSLANKSLYEMSEKGKREIAATMTYKQQRKPKQKVQANETLVFILLLFPIWWAIVGYLFNCSFICQASIVMIIVAGGILGFIVVFACSGGAGGSSEMNAFEWRCMSIYALIHNLILVRVVFSGKQKKKIPV